MHGWTSGDRKINNIIKNFQRNATKYEEVIEWIPSEKLINLKKIREESEIIIFTATWVDGIRTINKISNEKYEKSRSEQCGVILILYGTKKINFVIKEFKKHMQQKKNSVYGISKDMETNHYIIVTQDESMRRASNGKCTNCDRYNTSLVWCQLCDPWRETQGWTNENKVIDVLIKGFQINATGYENVIEWIPFDELSNIIDIQNIKKELNNERSHLETKELDLVSRATWKKGIRTVKCESGNYKRSRTASYVNLMELQKKKIDKNDQGNIEYME
ncbi:hypothetical protein C2G38_1000202 [Gigaspora rosea]|uniref:Uncharacterized protein n=1 Tax=Gigaspora rosea TaxID=44941 RepID=A0A397VN27_9GLOM|nr:hypothetical protein C2G38_1000202 [Gigaspora rosea]